MCFQPPIVWFPGDSDCGGSGDTGGTLDAFQLIAFLLRYDSNNLGKKEPLNLYLPKQKIQHLFLIDDKLFQFLQYCFADGIKCQQQQ